MDLSNIPKEILDAQTWGAVVQPSEGAAGFGSIARIALPRSYARAWRIQFDQPLLPPPNGGRGLATTSQCPSVRGVLAQLRYGLDGGRQSVVNIDWPAQGASYTVWGSTVEIAVDMATLAAVPTANRPALRGWVAPADGAGGYASPYDMPCRTLLVESPFAGPGTSVRQLVPERAVAWQFASQYDVTPGQDVTRVTFFNGDFLSNTFQRWKPESAAAVGAQSAGMIPWQPIPQASNAWAIVLSAGEQVQNGQMRFALAL